jgi:hypothetical protein
MTTINPLYNEEEEDGLKFVPITEPSLFLLSLHNHIQICNSYTTSLANRNDDEGNPKLQRPIYVVLRVTTKYAFDHIVGLIQSYLPEINMFVKEKEMPSLNTRTCLAIIGMTANWCLVSLRKTLHKDLERHVENLQTSSWVDTKFFHHRVPTFLLRKNKMRMHKMNSLMSKQDAEFFNYCERLRQCFVFELADDLILNGWQKGAHGYVPEVKEDNIIHLEYENVNSMNIFHFHPTKSKMRKLTHLHQRHQADGACIVEHGINFKRAATGTRPEDLFPGMCSSRVSAGHNIHESHNHFQQGGTMTVAFSQLASYVLLSGVDQSGLGC